MDLPRWLVTLARPNLHAKLSRLSKRLGASEKTIFSHSEASQSANSATRRVPKLHCCRCFGDFIVVLPGRTNGLVEGRARPVGIRRKGSRFGFLDSRDP